MNELSDSIAWPSRDPQWVSKVLLNGLILLIPVLGWLVVLGWMLAALDNLRAGQPVLPRASFSYVRRGVNLFVVYLAYGVALGVVFGLLFVAGLAMTRSASGGAGVLGVLLILLGYGFILVAALAVTMLGPVLIVATERGGIAGGLNLAGVIRLVNADIEETLHAGLFALVASLIGGVGAIVCVIGQAFTTPYGCAVLAGVAHHYERNAVLPATSTPVA